MKPDNKKDAVIAALIKLAKEEPYRAGSRFPPERELAKQLGVGRNVLREGMIALEAMGIIEKKERLGVFVKASATEGIMDSLQHIQVPPIEFMPMQMEVRMMISVPAVELAAVRRTDEDLEKLWKCFEDFSNAPFSSPEEELVNAKWEALLHHLEAEAAHNTLLSRINESISSLIERNNAFVHHHVLKNPGWFEHIKEQHRLIIQAIEDKQPHTAGKILREHIIESYEAIRASYPQYFTTGTKIYWEAVGLPKEY